MRKLRQQVFFLLILTILGFAHIGVADPLDNWSWRFPNPQGSTLRAVTYGNGLFVAAGDNGTIVISGDGYHWTNCVSGLSNNLYGITFCYNDYVATGDSGVILTSPNGADWTQRTSPITNTLRCASALSLSQCILAGDAGAVLLSLDNTNWVKINPGITNNFYAATFYGNDFCAIVGDGGAIWTCIPSEYPPGTYRWINFSQGVSNNFRSILWGAPGATFLTGGFINQPTVYPATSAEITTFSSINFTHSTNYSLSAWDPPSYFSVTGIGYQYQSFGHQVYVAIGYSANTLEYNYPGTIVTSPDGTNWYGLSEFTSGTSLYGLTYANGMFVAVGDAGSILVSTNGTNWTGLSGNHRSYFTAMAASENLIVASAVEGYQYSEWVNRNLTTMISTNGVNWTIATTNVPPMSDLISANGLFVGVSGDCIYTTTDGYNWTNNCISTNSLRGVVYGQGQFVAVGDQGTIFTSSNGFNWSNCSLNLASNFYCVCYANGQFIASGGVTAASSNGLNWSLYAINPPAPLTKIIFGNGIYVAADNPSGNAPNGNLLSSVDGLNWQIRYAQGNGFVISPAYVNGSFLALSGTTLLKSLDGTNWTSAPNKFPWLNNDWGYYYHLPDGPFYNTVSPILGVYNNTFILGGLDSILMQSGDARVPILTSSAKVTTNGFGFSFAPPAGYPFRVQSSTNLSLWNTIYSGTGTGQTTNFVDALLASPSSYYRVVSP